MTTKEETKESMTEYELKDEFTPLIEAKARADGTRLVKIIGPGWGASGYYSEKVLQEAVPVYNAYLHNYWNHQTEAEARERPERDLRDLASVTVQEAWYDNVGPTGPKGPAGPGIYTRVKPFSQYAQAITEMAPYIGMSHVAAGVRKPGEAEGRKGLIVEKISRVRSVDYVTKPGAKGAVLEAFREACKGPTCPLTGAQHSNITENEESMTDNITLEEVRKHPEIVEALQKEALDKVQNKDKLKEAETKLAESQKELDTLKESLARANEANLLREAKSFAEKTVEAVDLPDITKARIIETQAKNPATKDGKLDEAEFKKIIEDAVKTETDYLAKVTESGSIRGLGGGKGGSLSGNLEEAQKELIEAYIADGMDKDQAEKLVKGMT